MDKLWIYNSDEEIACEFCLNLYKLGQDILTQDLVFVISEEKNRWWHQNFWQR